MAKTTLTSKPAAKTAKVPALTITHFGVQHTLPLATIVDIKASTAERDAEFVGFVEITTANGASYTYFRELHDNQELALGAANDAVETLKVALGWETTLTATVEKFA